MKTISYFLSLLGVLSVSLGVSQTPAQPNIIFILTDDQSYGYLSCTGNEIVKTPNIDQIAEEGTLFTNAHISSAICTPSRASIFLGQFERKHGVNFNSGTSVAPEAWEDSYPVVMRRGGYYTGYIGKNHVPIGDGGYESGLMEKSFDYWYAAHGHIFFYSKERHPIFRKAQADTQLEILTEGVLDFLGGNEQKLEGALHFLDQRPEDKPFMLSLCFNLPHGASTSRMEQRPEDPEIYRTLFRDIDIPLPEDYIAKKDIKNPKLPPSIHLVENRQDAYAFAEHPESTKERYLRQMQAMTGIDQLVGKLQDKLKELQLDQNTILIFTSDHGLFMGQFGLGGKAFCYEQVTHVPMIIKNPLLGKKGMGRTSDALVQSIDIGPTMLSLAGIEIPASMQGKDISTLLEDEGAEVREYLFTENLWSTQFGNPRCESVQNKEWKYIRYYKNENFPANKKIETAKLLGINLTAMLYRVHDPDIAVYRNYVEAPLLGEQPVYEELYHLKKDPKETTNLIDQAPPNVLNLLRQKCDELLKEARGEDPPKVLRYTHQSKVEREKQG